MTSPSAFLDGIKVVDFGHYIAGAGAGVVFASLGADVIKVEPPHGEPTRHNVGGAYIKMFNHSKRAIAIDLRAPDGIGIAKRLIAGADVLIQNMRPGAMARLGIGPEDATALNPRLIYLSLCGFPSGSPSEKRAGYDAAAQAEGGMMSVTGDPGGPPQQVGSAIVDVAAMHLGVQAALAALIRRGRTGQGDRIEVSLLEVAVALQAQRWSGYLYNGEKPVRLGNRQPVLAPAAELLSTRDGHLVVSAYLQTHWRTLCEALGRPALADDPRFARVEARVANHGELIAELNALTTAFPSHELATLLGKAGIVCGRVNSYPEVRANEDFRVSGLLQPVSAADYETFGLPYRFASVARHTPKPAPAIGEHSTDILAEFGYDEREIADFLQAGVVVSASGGADAVSGIVKDATEQSFAGDVLRSDRPVLVDFWAPWCAPCAALMPIVDMLAETFRDSVSIVKVDIAAQPALMLRYGIMTVPTFALFKDGAAIDYVRGPTSQAALTRMLEAAAGHARR